MEIKYTLFLYIYYTKSTIAANNMCYVFLRSLQIRQLTNHTLQKYDFYTLHLGYLYHTDIENIS